VYTLSEQSLFFCDDEKCGKIICRFADNCLLLQLMIYVDVILPLPLEGLFTYRLPKDMHALKGVRVLVPLGKSKKYIGLVARVHEDTPSFEVRDVDEVLDSKPVATDSQLQLWQWIADYYLSPLGEVFNAALPQGLKVNGVYKPKMEVCIGLPEPMQTERMLHIALDMLRRSSKQYSVFTTFLEMSGWTSAFEEGQASPTSFCPEEVSRDELMNTSHCSSSVLKQLMDKKFLYVYEKEVGRLNYLHEPHFENIKPLSVVQQDAYNQLLMQFLRKKVVLLHGVTSSGKTEIYIHLIKRAIDRGEQVLYLLPEIALTVQMRERLQRVFGNRLGIYHSKYSDAERVEIWQKQLSGNPYDVILGARSAVLLPFQRLGLVIVDEEHENSFKQQDPMPRYHARSVAIMLAQMSGAKVLLGTATPCAETYYNSKCDSSKYGYVALTQRYQGLMLPKIEVVDVKDLQRRKMMTGPFSPMLLSAIRQALKQGEQVILFQNRRGFTPMVECKVCGWVPHCEHCDVSLTYHKATGQLSCHYCGYTYRVPEACPNCGNTDLHGRGFGTEKVEDRLMDIFPDVRVARMDLDSTRSRQAYERIINDFSAGRTDVLIGTQMVTKGLDFDRVSVVGILNADSMMNVPDFRAYEQAFMMMMQVAGRAGRKNKRGLVMLQTKNPDHPVVRQLVNNDYEGFYHNLVQERAAFRYPPFTRLIYVYLKHRDEQVVNTAAIEMGSRLRQLFGTRVLGPDKPAVARVKSLFIRKLVLKLELSLNANQVRQALRAVQGQLLEDKRYANLQLYYDVDPL